MQGFSSRNHGIGWDLPGQKRRRIIMGIPARPHLPGIAVGIAIAAQVAARIVLAHIDTLYAAAGSALVRIFGDGKEFPCHLLDTPPVDTDSVGNPQILQVYLFSTSLQGKAAGPAGTGHGS